MKKVFLFLILALVTISSGELYAQKKAIDSSANTKLADKYIKEIKQHIDNDSWESIERKSEKSDFKSSKTSKSFRVILSKIEKIEDTCDNPNEVLDRIAKLRESPMHIKLIGTEKETIDVMLEVLEEGVKYYDSSKHARVAQRSFGGRFRTFIARILDLIRPTPTILYPQF